MSVYLAGFAEYDIHLHSQQGESVPFSSVVNAVSTREPQSLVQFSLVDDSSDDDESRGVDQDGQFLASETV